MPFFSILYIRNFDLHFYFQIPQRQTAGVNGVANDAPVTRSCTPPFQTTLCIFEDLQENFLFVSTLPSVSAIKSGQMQISTPGNGVANDASVTRSCPPFQASRSSCGLGGQVVFLVHRRRKNFTNKYPLSPWYIKYVTTFPFPHRQIPSLFKPHLPALMI